MDNLCTPGTVTVTFFTFKYRQNRKETIDSCYKLPASNPGPFSTPPFLKYRSRTNMFFTFFFLPFLSTSHTPSQRTAASWLNAPVYCHKYPKYKSCTHAHTHAHSHSQLFSKTLHLQKIYLHQLIVTYVPSMVDNVVKML